MSRAHPSIDQTFMGSTALPTLLTALTLGARRFFVVEQGHAKIVARFGKPRYVAAPGLHSCFSLWGMVDQVATFEYSEVTLGEKGTRQHERKRFDHVPTREVIDEHREANVMTKDGNRCTLEAVLFYRVQDPMRAVYEITDYVLAIEKLVQSLLRNECGKYAVRELMVSRASIAHELQVTLERETAPWGVSVRLVELKSIEVGGG